MLSARRESIQWRDGEHEPNLKSAIIIYPMANKILTGGKILGTNEPRGKILGTNAAGGKNLGKEASRW